ncbi:TM2 domain-containing protein [Brachyspira aalborgi]|uniref:TM2 domain-containing protein n=1 Tax=Brachyspira aalborgi TaxID=29522 RepID=UPI0011CA1401|nr:TM2 domain-containing protein [Brachyspira aalborgi]TXJ52741.1 TM2 domain-containing protein [Brachyspira aalborgi]
MSEENNLQVSKQADEQFCSSCGKPIKIKAEICPHCGVRQSGSKEKSDKSWGVCLLLSILFGWAGVDRLYAGRIVSGIIILLYTVVFMPIVSIVTLGIMFLFLAPLSGLIWLIEIIIVATGNLKDRDNKYITKD